MHTQCQRQELAGVEIKVKFSIYLVRVKLQTSIPCRENCTFQAMLATISYSRGMPSVGGVFPAPWQLKGGKEFFCFVPRWNNTESSRKRNRS